MTDLAVVPAQDKAPNYSVTYTLRVTDAMNKRIDQILENKGRETSRNDLLREAIRVYLDEQEDLIGSRRNFSKSLQNHMDLHERRIIFYLNIIIYMLASSLAVILQVVNKDSKVQSVNLISAAIAESVKDGPTLNNQIQQVRTHYQLE